jgi:thiol-disulfide isomerase/thioredoxin
VPLVMPLLDDADPRVVARAEVALARWTKQDFGARVFLAIPPPQGAAQSPSAKNLDKLRQAVERRKEWWQLHSQEFETNASPPRVARLTAPLRPPLTDFSLRDLDGRPVRLSDFKGRPVLLNFWATWCTACLAEMPELIALRKELGDRVAIIGVALDGVTDEDGHTPGHEEGEAHQEARSLSEIRKQVLRAVKRRNLDYTVVMDADYSIGARFNGGELPTTVIIDASGRVRRRFIGERSREVFEAMIAEAERE